jgi:hypothetical protein
MADCLLHPMSNQLGSSVMSSHYIFAQARHVELQPKYNESNIFYYILLEVF